MMFLEMWVLQAKMKLAEFFKKENGDVNVVSIVILIGIAVLLAVIFKGRITKLLNDLFDTIEGSAKNAVTQ